MRVRTPHAGSLRFPEQRQSSQGESGAKSRLRSVDDAQAVHILLPPTTVLTPVDSVLTWRNPSRSSRRKPAPRERFCSSVRRDEGAVYMTVTEEQRSDRTKDPRR